MIDWLKKPLRTAAISIQLMSLLVLTACAQNTETAQDTDSTQNEPVLMAVHNPTPDDDEPKSDNTVRIGILLDTSNSMDGLIGQAKSQLWKIVNELTKARIDNARPNLEIALYEYGNDGLPYEEGFVRMVTPLTDDLDKLSFDLFNLTTNGGSEYCGHVIQTSLKQLTWSQKEKDLQIIFIAGNEAFNQGDTHYAPVCETAKDRGIIVNTIFCGDRMEGIRTSWFDGADKAGGAYNFIDHNKGTQYVATPFDDKITELNVKLNGTYLAFGAKADWYSSNQTIQDGNATSFSRSTLVERAITKSSGYYKNTKWDLVDATAEKGFKFKEVKKKELPKEMQTMTDAEAQKYIDDKRKEREAIQAQISDLTMKREQWLNDNQNGSQNELEAAILEAIRKQARDKGYTFI